MNPEEPKTYGLPEGYGEPEEPEEPQEAQDYEPLPELPASSRKRHVILTLLAVILTAAVVLLGSYAYLEFSGRAIVDRAEYEELAAIKAEYAKMLRIQRTIDDRFLWEYDQDAEKEAIYRAMLASLDDKYSRYLNQDDVADLTSTLNSSFTGIGTVIEFNEEKGLVVVDVISGSPAEQAGLQAGDVIRLVDGNPVEDLASATAAIRGEAGTTVTITYVRGKEEKEIKVIRGEIKDASIVTSTIDGDLGYIRIYSFGDETFHKFDAAMTKYETEGYRGVIIDLRNNPGGLFDEGIKIADRILPECLITYTEDKNGVRKEHKSDGATTALPIAVLVNENSASTSEVVAAAIKENNGGTIIGKTTFGKGIVQETTMFEDGSAMSITTRQYFSPKGNVIHGKGVEPDLVVEPGKAGEDPQLEAAKALF